MDLKLAIALSKNPREPNKAIIYHGLENIFDIICCGEEYKNKSDPYILNYIMKLFNVSSKDFLKVGNTTTGIAFANNAGGKTVAVTFSAHSVEQIQDLEPYAIINNLGQLLEVIDKLCHSTQKSCQL